MRAAPGKRRQAASASRAAGDKDIGARIVEAAAQAIIANGFGGVSTEEIARVARTSKRSIYQRFPNKDALFENVMAYLCTRAAGDGESVAPTGDLETDVRSYALAALVRFAHPEVRAILVAAIGASQQYPAALEIFWDRGPGQAAAGIASVLDVHKKRGSIKAIRSRQVARRFLLDCCGPVVLGQLFGQKRTTSRASLERHVDGKVRALIEEIGVHPA